MTMENSIWGDVFETDPTGQRALFQSLLPQSANPIQEQQFSSLFQPTFNRYLGELGKQVRGGGTPSLSFTDFVNNLNPQRELLRFNEPRGVNTGMAQFNTRR